MSAIVGLSPAQMAAIRQRLEKTPPMWDAFEKARVFGQRNDDIAALLKHIAWMEAELERAKSAMADAFDEGAHLAIKGAALTWPRGESFGISNPYRSPGPR